MAIADKDNPLLRDPTPEEFRAFREMFLRNIAPRPRPEPEPEPKPKPPRPAPTLESLQREVDELRNEIKKIHQDMFAASLDAALSR